MVSAEEKRDFLKQLIDMAAQPDSIAQVEEALYQLLLRDTNGGKLYKFRSFDKKGYALKSVRTGTLHCSKPAVFNDPFDCKIGVTFQSIYQALYGEEFDLIAEVFNLFVGVVHKEVEMQNLNDDERRLVQRLLDNKALTSFAAEYRGVAKSEEEMGRLLHENGLVIVELLQTVLADEVFGSSLRVCSQMLPKIIGQLTPEGMLQISDDNATFEDYARANGVMEDDDEIGLTMRMSEKISPELTLAREDTERLLNSMEQQMTERMSSTFLVGCLCTDFKNRLMWSHYADSHKGFCIEYDFSKKQDLLPFPIYYSKERPLVPWKAALDNSPENISEATAELMLGVLTKDSDWSYENEWRILIKASQEADVKMPPITCIYLGAGISECNRVKILKIANKLHIPVKQMKVDRGAYALHAELITKE